MSNFEKLETWQEAITFADLVYQVTNRSADAGLLSWGR